MNVDHEIGLLIAEVTRLGAPSAAHGGKIAVRPPRLAPAPPSRCAGLGRVPALARGALLCSGWLMLRPPAHAQVKFGTIVKDERCGDLFEALVGTLRAAKKRKVVDFQGEMLLQGACAGRARAARAAPGSRFGGVARARPAALTRRRAGAHDDVDVVLLRDSYP